MRVTPKLRMGVRDDSKNLLTFFAVAVLLALLFVFRGAAERALFGPLMRTATGLDAAADDVVLTGNGIRLTEVRVADPGAGAHFGARRLDATIDVAELLSGPRGGKSTFTLALTAPSATISRDEARGAAAEFAALHLERWGARATVGDGSITSGALVLNSIDGGAALTGPHFTYDVRAAVVDGARRYVIAGSAIEGGGTTTHAWSAAALPLAPLAGFIASPQLEVTGGLLRSFTFNSVVASGSSPHYQAAARLERGDLTLGTPPHALAGLHGAITLSDAALASPNLAGTIDGHPFQALGEVYDGGRRLERLLLDVAAEPNLQEVRIEGIAPGIAFAKYGLLPPYGKLAIHVLSIDPKEPTISFNTAVANDHVISSGERTSTMGVRTGAVAGVNGDYFDIGRTYAPQGILIHSGRLLRSPTDRMALTVHRGNRFTFEEYRFNGTLTTSSGSFAITLFNDLPGKISIITEDYGKLPAAPGVTFVALSPLASQPHRYRVENVSPLSAAAPATFGLAFGPKAGGKPPRVGEIVTVEYGLTPAYDDVIAAVGGGPLLVKDGAWYEDRHAPAPDERDVRWPVVGAGVRPSDGTLFFFEVDGRWPDISVGMTRPEFGELMIRYGVSDGFALDSGGSAGIVVRTPGEKTVSVRNHPSDQSYERYVTDALFVYSSAPPPNLPPPAPTSLPAPR